MISFRQPFKREYPITLDYGEEWLPTYKKGEHKGIDFGCPLGTPILASADGKIKTRGYEENGYGYYILIEHKDGSGSLYAHLNRFKIQLNELVSQGDVIGESGSSGKSSGPHLHFEIRTNAISLKTAIDPKTKLQSFWDPDPVSTPELTPIQTHQPLHSGWAKIICDSANVRCHCDPNRILGQRKKDFVLFISKDSIIYKGLPYRSYFDNETGCKLLIAEYDAYGTQILEQSQ